MKLHLLARKKTYLPLCLTESIPCCTQEWLLGDQIPEKYLPCTFLKKCLLCVQISIKDLMHYKNFSTVDPHHHLGKIKMFAFYGKQNARLL